MSIVDHKIGSAAQPEVQRRPTTGTMRGKFGEVRMRTDRKTDILCSLYQGQSNTHRCCTIRQNVTRRSGRNAAMTRRCKQCLCQTRRDTGPSTGP